MPLSLLIPENISPLLEDFDAGDVEALYYRLRTWPGRKLLFTEEKVVGFVVSTGSDPENLYLSVQSNADADADAAPAPAQPEFHAVLRFPISAQVDDNVVAVWKFEVPVGYTDNSAFTITVSTANSLLAESVAESVKTSLAVLSDTIFDELRLPGPAASQTTQSDTEGATADTSKSTDETVETGMTATAPPKPPAKDTGNTTAVASDQPSETVPDTVPDTATLTVPTALPLVLRLRSTKPSGRNDVLITTLTLEASPALAAHAHHDSFFSILALDAAFKSGSVAALTPLTFPLRCGVRDVVSMSYRLAAHDLDQNTPPRPLHLNIRVQILRRDPCSRVVVAASNIISTQWLPLLEFGLVAPPLSNTLRRTRTPHVVQAQFLPALPAASLPALGRAVSTSGKTKAYAKSTSSLTAKSTASLPVPSRSAVTVNVATHASSSLSGLRLTFEGSLSVPLGSIATWKIHCVNHSTRTLQLSVLVKHAHAPDKLIDRHVSGLGVSIPVPPPPGADNLIHNRAQLHYQYNLAKLSREGVVVLTNDIRLGPIDPGGVYEAEIQLIGISKGMFNLDGLKIVDLHTGDGIDFGRLVEVFVVSAAD